MSEIKRESVLNSNNFFSIEPISMNETKVLEQKKSNLELCIQIWENDKEYEEEPVIFVMSMNTDTTKNFKKNKYVFIVESNDEKGCLVKVRYADINMIKENEKKIKTTYDTFLNRYESLERALQKTNEALNKYNDQFNRNIIKELFSNSESGAGTGTETDTSAFDEKFIRDNENLLALIAGEKQISIQSEKELDMMRHQEYIDVQRQICEEFTWKMEQGECVNLFGILKAKFFLRKKVDIEFEAIENYIITTQVPIAFKNHRFEISNDLYDVLIQNDNEHFSIFRMKVQKCGNIFICDPLASDEERFCSLTMKQADRVLPIKTYRLSDFEVDDKVFIRPCWDDGGFKNCFLIGKVDNITENIWIKYQSGHIELCDLERLRKYTDVPEKYRDLIK
ncbi:MAG: hypothetical protein Dasosvirus1_18 [Dasosvirus sp.]|uniref:Uncharacterized protein n=1 Tax=Dasosvirus sp. TaxID=2487764 RepID=A0A3G4ZUV1_9VIRU|nr:MAG: hypothetical protein Dasosvirus1_18 [Dasosvirus sp.]